ncbi:hypothetical protein C8N35_11053 [Breoghania corrubedonensis]|uniref:Penicillin-insensitive murein endopeptidase n=1 Tax=Breoghania corrubedonensis TaxID=665038 RepID=A0A2T5V1D6_9HYPH|nr:hypothetical protein [Breoghania corrubedonensis]PTW57574.1 hypothetical protein C8N35_11053 [Breoghania corrubedonensis]
MRVIGLLVAFLVLTALTQIGGIALVVTWFALRLLRSRHMSPVWRTTIAGTLFIVLYGVLTVFIVPPLAARDGRIALPCLADRGRHYTAANPIFCLLNRNYVVPQLAELLNALSRDVATTFPGTTTLFLDANLPFWDGFPLLPHLSHKDGRKLDLAFYYQNSDGDYLPGATKSPIGYWAFEQPKPDEPPSCPAKNLLTLRWDMVWLQPLWPDFRLDEARTQHALVWLFHNGREHGLQRVFVEPHLAHRLDVESPDLGFQGCRAARHDDHIHIQVVGRNLTTSAHNSP